MRHMITLIFLLQLYQKLDPRVLTWWKVDQKWRGNKISYSRIWVRKCTGVSLHVRNISFKCLSGSKIMIPWAKRVWFGQIMISCNQIYFINITCLIELNYFDYYFYFNTENRTWNFLTQRVIIRFSVECCFRVNSDSTTFSR